MIHLRPAYRTIFRHVNILLHKTVLDEEVTVESLQVEMCFPAGLPGNECIAEFTCDLALRTCDFT